MWQITCLLHAQGDEPADDESMGPGGDGDPNPPPPPCDENHPNWPDC